MKFVTKKEFEDAIATLKLATKNGQVRYGHHENTEEMTMVVFSNMDMSLAAAESVIFITPVAAAKAKLFSVRNKLSKNKQAHTEKGKELEALENEANQIATILTTLKE